MKESEKITMDPLTVSINKTVPFRSKLKNACLRYEAELSGAIFLTFVLLYLTGYRSVGNQFFFVSHQVGPDQFEKGKNDFCFLFFWTNMFTFIRVVFINHICLPILNHFHIGPKAKRLRVAEQLYTCLYYLVFGTLGMHIMYYSPYWLNTSEFWKGYPHEIISQEMKYYYLMQLAFWFQQMYCLHIEKRRKDHYAMLSHHIITIFLVGSSYYCNITRAGNAVLCCMDLSDILLSLAKVLKYLGFEVICNITFGLFTLSWPITRHIFYTIVIWSVAVEPKYYMDMTWNPAEGKYFTPFTQSIWVGSLVILNLLMVYWFVMIVKVIVRLLTQDDACDPRSDDEDETTSGCDAIDEKVLPLEEKHALKHL
ncbi:TLC domain-containing protein [Mycotypha africana]|uniref:TLC domain-containing protein n=1 Tax=Mycotypha africana TaxID=64632 RepID=UPI0023000136|nr:TLC domain-containing protein [Mycotypha africana]KAI8982175.1 TLC domain-containing protein [Mycotypha africana]